MITGYQISIEEGRVHLYVIAGYDQLRMAWTINAFINFVGVNCSELLPTECYGLPALEIDVECMGSTDHVNQVAQDYADRINKQIGNGPLPVPTQGETEG